MSDLKANLSDNSQAWLLQPDGQYLRASPGDEPVFQVQNELLKTYSQ
jgi:polyphosphate kinase